MRRIKYGVIGIGWFGEKHCEVLADLAGVELYALCTRTPERLARVAARFGVTRVFSDYREMLTDLDLEAVSITTMWDQHAAPTLAALASGKHVFLEKPMASTLADCLAITRAAEASPKSFMVGHICRFNPRYAAAKREIELGRIGRILSVYARRNLPAEISAGVLNRISPIMGDGIHDTDLMLWYTGAKIETAYAQTTNVRGLGYPDIGWTMYRFDSGATGVCENIWCLPDKTAFYIDERMEIIGTDGAVHIQDTHPDFSIVDVEGWRSLDTTYWPVLHGIRSGALRAELEYFVTCAMQGRKPDIILPEESRQATEACLAAEASARLGRPVRVEELSSL